MKRRNFFKFLSTAPVGGLILQKSLTAEQVSQASKVDWETEYSNIFGLPMQRVEGSWRLICDPPNKILRFGKTFTYNTALGMYVMDENTVKV